MLFCDFTHLLVHGDGRYYFSCSHEIESPYYFFSKFATSEQAFFPILKNKRIFKYAIMFKNVIDNFCIDTFYKLTL